MSSADGPRVPLRTGSSALRPVPRSLSSNVLPLFSVISAAAFRVGPLRGSAAGRVSRLNKEGLHGPLAEIKAPSDLLAGSHTRRAALVCAWSRCGTRVLSRLRKPQEENDAGVTAARAPAATDRQ